MPRSVRLVAVGAALATQLACLADLPEVEAPCATWKEPGLYRLPVPGFDRKPFVYVPATAGPRPAVFMLHGANRTADQMMNEVTRFLAMAEDQGFVAVFPNGTGTPLGYFWNAGSCCGTGTIGNVDDVGFLDAAVQTLEDRACVGDVVATGHSNGAMMALRWACESDVVDAVMASAGPLLTEACGGAPFPVTYVHGTADKIVPLLGGDNADLAKFPPAREAFQPVVDVNGCSTVTETVTEGVAVCTTWADCEAPTRFCELTDWQHIWPGGRKNRPAGFDAETETLRRLADAAPE